MKLFLTLLTHHNLPALKRLVKSAENQYPESSLDVETVIVVNTLSDEYYQSVLDEKFSFKVIRTDSNGKPGRGKNSCKDLFLESDADFICQIDGDDILYPTCIKSIAQHIHHYPDLDVLGAVPVDVVRTYQPLGHTFRCGPNDEFHGGVWGTSMCANQPHGPGKGAWVDEQSPCSYDFILLQSKRSAVLRIDEDQPNGEDHLYSIQLLAEHQKRNLRYFLTMSSDFQVIDATATDSIQSQFPFTESVVAEMKTKMLKAVQPWRSSMDELPIIFNELLLSQDEKAVIIKKIF